MPSPFPGMDPWLERPGVFPDLHNGLIFLLRESLNAVLPPGYFAAGANRVWVDDEHHREPDVSVARSNGPVADGGVSVAAFTRLGMLVVDAPVLPEPTEEPYLEIRSTDGDRLVTVLEVLSLSNKSAATPGRAAYVQKQGEMRSRGVNLVEIDLLRGGTHTTAISLAQLRQRAGAFDYHVCVRAAGVPGRIFVSPIRLSDRLPAVAVPLDAGTRPVEIDLQPLFDRCYDSGRYAARARYAEQLPDPPLIPEQRTWAEGILRAKGLLR